MTTSLCFLALAIHTPLEPMFPLFVVVLELCSHWNYSLQFIGHRYFLESRNVVL